MPGPPICPGTTLGTAHHARTTHLSRAALGTAHHARTTHLSRTALGTAHHARTTHLSRTALGTAHLPGPPWTMPGRPLGATHSITPGTLTGSHPVGLPGMG